MFKCDVCKQRKEFIAVAVKDGENINICIDCLKKEKENAVEKEGKKVES